MKKVIGFLIFMLLLVFPLQTQASSNLQTLIDAANEGDTLFLQAETYKGNIIISKPLTIVGKKGTVIAGDGTGNVVSIQAPNVTIKNVHVKGSSMDRNSAEEYAAIKVYTNDNVLEGITVTNSFHGIYLSQAHHNIIRSSTITGWGKGDIASQGNGLHMYYSNDNLLDANMITGTRDGMYFDYANDNLIEDNQISETRYGLHYMYSDRNTFSQNVFTFNTGGAAIMNSNGNQLKDNQFVFNYGNQSFGLMLLQANDSVIAHNTFFLNQRGLYIDQSTNNLFTDNALVKNQIGIELWASSNEQVFTRNEIHDNTLPMVALGGQGRNQWSLDGVGNAWGSSMPVLDLDQNGVGDHALTYESSLPTLLEEQELTYLFLKSPAIAVYEKINQLFHQRQRMMEDPYPLISQSGNKLYVGTTTILLVVTACILIMFGKRRGISRCITSRKSGRKVSAQRDSI